MEDGWRNSAWTGLVPCLVPCGEFTSETTRFGSGLVKVVVFYGIECSRHDRLPMRRGEENERI